MKGKQRFQSTVTETEDAQHRIEDGCLQEKSFQKRKPEDAHQQTAVAELGQELLLKRKKKHCNPLDNFKITYTQD